MIHKKVGWRVIAALVVVIALTAMSFIVPSASSKPTKATGNPIVWNQNKSDPWVTVYTTVNLSTGQGAGAMARLKNGKNIRMICWTDARYPFTGNKPSVRWFLIEFKYDVFNWRTARGWVHSTFVYYQTAVPHC